MNSIFDIESRIDLEEEFEHILEDYHATTIKTVNMGSHSIYYLMNRTIKAWICRRVNRFFKQ